MQTKRRSREESNAENEAAVLGAARQHFERLGYHGATVEAIAEQAGFSKGAVYSRYRTREDLFLAVLERSIDDRQRDVDALIAAGETGRLMAFAIGQSTGTLAWQAALIEFRIHASRLPPINARYRALHERAVANVARSIGVECERRGYAPAQQPRDLAVAALAGTTGIVVERLVDPGVDGVALLRGIPEVIRLAGSS